MMNYAWYFSQSETVRNTLISYGTGHYLSPGILGGGIHLIFRRTKGGSVVTENPKGGSLKNLEGFRGGTTQICLKNEDMGWGGGDCESHQTLLGGSLQ